MDGGNTSNTQSSINSDMLPDVELGQWSSAMPDNDKTYPFTLTRGDGPSSKRPSVKSFIIDMSSKDASETSSDNNKNHDDNSCNSRRSITMITLQTVKMHKKRIFALLIFLVGACASAAFLSIGLTAAYDAKDAQFDRHTSEMTTNILESWSDYELFGLWVHESCRQRARVNTTLGICTRQDFQDLYEYITSVGLAIQSMQFMPIVSHDQRQEIEDESRAYYEEHYPYVNYRGIMGVFVNSQRGEGSGFYSKPQENRSLYWPIHYLLPVEGNEEAIDLDMYSTTSQKKIIDNVLASWQPAVSERLQLDHQGSGESTSSAPYSVILHHPGIRLKSHYAPGRAATGISLMVIKISEVLKRASVGVKDSSSLYIYDATKSNTDPDEYKPDFLGASTVYVQDDNVVTLDALPEISLEQLEKHASSQSRKMQHRTIKIADRQWIVAVVSLEGSFRPEYLLVSLGGSLIVLASLILSTCFFTHMNRVAKVNKVKAQAAQEKSQIIVETAKQQAMAERQLNEYIAHEVRNPLSSAIAALSFVSAATKEPDQSEEQQQLLKDDIRIIDASLQFINELLRNMLDMNRASHQEMKITLAPTDILRDVLEPVASILYLRGNKVDILIECPPNIVCLSDRLRLKQIILNLAMNATKFVCHGFIRLRCVVYEEEGSARSPTIQLHLEDSGPGIPAEKRGNLFAKFQESLDLLNQGTGIGLCLCQHLTNLLNGTLWLDEEYSSGIEGHPGTRFVLDLNVPPMENWGQESDPRMDYIHDEQHHPTEEKLDSGELVVHYPPRGVDDPIDTSFVSSEFILSPEKPLKNVCKRDLSQSGPYESQSAGEVTQTTTPLAVPENTGYQLLPEKLSVLFVDDDTVLRKLFNRSLKRVAPGWEISESANGETALHLCKSSTYDLIFMDQYMASVEKQLLGTETVRELRATGNTSRICGLSANDAEENFLDAGADCFLFKPFPCEPKALNRALSNILNSPSKSRARRMSKLPG